MYVSEIDTNYVTNMEYGVTLPTKKGFGFIRSCSTQLDIFFHMSSIQGISTEELQQGGVPVSFSMVPDTRQASKRDVAVDVQHAPAERVVFKRVSDQTIIGQIIQLPERTIQKNSRQGSSSSGAGLLRFMDAQRKPRHASLDIRDQQVCVPSQICMSSEMAEPIPGATGIKRQTYSHIINTPTLLTRCHMVWPITLC